MEDWFKCDSLHIVKMAKYWAAEEMAATIYNETMFLNVCWALNNFPYLIQILKKEWFR